MKVAWSSSHGEFLISDSYYFSVLERESKKRNIEIVEIADFEELFSYPVVVFNYSEVPFNEKEIETIEKAVSDGKRVIFTGHFKNKDNVVRICNAVSERFGLRLNEDEVLDYKNFAGDDHRIVVTSRIEAYGDGVKRVVFPYSAPLEILSSEVRVILKGEDTSFAGCGKKAPVLAAERRYPSGGSFVLCGSCLFWDNYSILREDNLTFSLNLLNS
ncbi:MAG: hypothetical protein L5655_05215 [Thermosediminibacteraceae bacterium]|nr:hypothetical protein [Thermosediminibacteraceae bacterium]